MPKAVRTATLKEIREVEERTNANVRIGSYQMNASCPIDEFSFFHLQLTASDLDRVFLLHEFYIHTKGHTCKLRDISETAESMAMERRPQGEINSVDLTLLTNWEPVLVTNSIDSGPLIAIDGNHRLTAHFARAGAVDAVKVFVAVHPKVLTWAFVPPLARRMQCE